MRTLQVYADLRTLQVYPPCRSTHPAHTTCSASLRWRGALRRNQSAAAGWSRDSVFRRLLGPLQILTRKLRPRLALDNVNANQEGPLDEEAAVQPANEEPANEEPAEESHPRGQAQAMEAQQIEAQEESEDAVVAETGMAAPIVAPAAGEGGAIRGGPGGRRRKAPHRKQPCMKHLST